MFRKTLLVMATAFMVMLASVSGISAQSSMAKVRVVHASPDAPAVDVWVDGKKALTNVPFFAASDYLDLAAGSHDLKVVATGTTEPAVIDAKGVTVEAGKAYTIAAVGKLAEIKPAIFVDNLASPASGKAHVRVLHLSPDAPAVDVKVANGPTLTAIRTQHGAVMVAAQLPPLAAGRTYQLWLQHNNIVMSAGTFHVGFSGHGAIMLAEGTPQADVYMITEEPEGGSTDPTTPALISGQGVSAVFQSNH